MSGTRHIAKTGNRLLDALGPSEFRRLEPQLTPMRLHFKQVLYEPDLRITHVYFPTNGVVSLVTVLQDDQPIEAGTVGREGMAGLSAFFAMSRPSTRAICQVPGSALKLPAADLVAEVGRHGGLELGLLRYTNALIAMVSQTAACNRAHVVEARMARWLLMTRDRLDTDDFPLTQEFLGHMLGVSRPTVSLAGASLQAAKLINYSRGKITILDREGLEEFACECYAHVHDMFAAASRMRSDAR